MESRGVNCGLGSSNFGFWNTEREQYSVGGGEQESRGDVRVRGEVMGYGNEEGYNSRCIFLSIKLIPRRATTISPGQIDLFL